MIFIKTHSHIVFLRTGFKIFEENFKKLCDYVFYLKFQYLLLFVFTVFLSCSNDSAPQPQNQELAFFDLKSYFQTEIERLSDLRNISKTTEVNGETETKVLDSIDWKNDLKIFSDSDINKPAWTDKYSIDSLKNENGKLSQIKYEALDLKMKTKLLEIDFENEKVSKIIIEKAASSAISEVAERLIYEPQKGFKIDRSQDITGAGKNEFKVRVEF